MSIEDHAANVIADLEGDDSDDSNAHASSGDADESTPVVNTNAPVETKQEATPPATAEELSEADRLLQEAGYKAKRSDGRYNPIPYNRVRTIIDNQLKKDRAVWEGKVTEATGKISAYEAKIQELESVGQIMETDPDRFLQMMSQIHPGYAKFLSSASERSGEREAAAPASRRSNSPAPKEMPQPDLQLPDGSATYSMEGLQKLLDWNSAQTEQRLAQRYAPIEQTVAGWQQQQQVQAFRQQAEVAIAETLKEASTWPGFMEAQAEIAKVMADNPKISLEGAYRKVVMPKYTSDHNRVREQVLAEIKGRPTSTSAPVRTGTSSAPAKGRSIEEIAAAAAKRLGGID
jgi:hypothetical protein